MFDFNFAQFAPYFQQFLGIVKNWFWILLPFILWKPFSFLYLFWRKSCFEKSIEKILLEIRIPKDVVKPIRAMESVMSGLRQVLYDPPDTWEKWIEGKNQVSAVLEIAAIDGVPHFFIRIPKPTKQSVESVIYAQYPDAEITEAPDYTKFVPQDIPNKEWDVWGDNYSLLKPDAYPIKTYKEFETERETLEEKRIDPLSSLLEGMAQLKKGEQIWVQIKIAPIQGDCWGEEAKKIKNELARRSEKKTKNKLMIGEAGELLFKAKLPTGPETVGGEEEAMIPPEMKLTPGERQKLTAIENKISQLGMKTNIRFLYLGKRETFFKGRLRLVFGFFGDLSTSDLNYIKPMGQPTITKIKKSFFLPINLLRNRRLYLRKRNIFKKYVKRLPPFFPRGGGTHVFSIEELVTLFHFPGKGVTPAPYIERVESKRGRAPMNLPGE